MEMGTGTEPPRPPQQADLIIVCRALNDAGARYLVVGGMAIIQHGFLRATEDIDLLIDPDPGNIGKVCEALEVLPDKAIRELEEGDLDRYRVVRVVDDIIIDLMLETCGFSYADSVSETELFEIEGVRIPFASAALLLRMKQTGREKDILDVMYLMQRTGRKP
jgi:hypothetical protein